MLKITPSAAQEIKRLQDTRATNYSTIELNVKPGGCCGLYYTLEFVKAGSGVITESEGITVAIAPEAQAYLGNITIDYAEDLMGGGFRFDNSLATSTCSCSQSFALES